MRLFFFGKYKLFEFHKAQAFLNNQFEVQCNIKGGYCDTPSTHCRTNDLSG